MTIHIMLDLETWGKKPGCDLRSIGACVFDPITGRVSDNAQTYGVMHDPEGITNGSFYVATDNPSVPFEKGIVYLDSGYTAQNANYPHWDAASDRYCKYALTRDPETVQWWSDQSEEAQAAFANPIDLRGALGEFSAWLSKVTGEWVLTDNVRLWSHGPAFDVSILAAAYDAVNLPVPWHYRAPRDTRTCFDMAGIEDHSAFMKGFDYGTAHHALHDAISQARAVCGAYEKAREPRWLADRLHEAIVSARRQFDDGQQNAAFYNLGVAIGVRDRTDEGEEPSDE